MIYLAHEDTAFTRSSDCVTENGNGRTSALDVIELANWPIVTSLSGTRH